MTWLDQPLLALDSETTGTRPDFDRILTLCIGRSSKLGTWVSRTWRINPGVPIPPESTAVHGIGDADVTGWAQPFDALIEIGQWLDAAAANRRPLEADALASLKLLHILAGLNDLLPLITPATLHEAQQGWWVQQQDTAEARALGSGTAFERQDCWPLIPFTDGAES